MRAIGIGGAILALAACGSEVEPETAETIGNAMPTNTVTDEEPVPEVGSVYTTLDDCEVVAQNREEGGFLQRRCQGHADYDLLVTSADGREHLALLNDEYEEERDLAFQQVIAQGHPSEIGDTVEWRGPTPEAPNVLIVRVEVAESDDPMAAETSYLAVVQLDGPTCVVARVPPGPGQNVAARRFADRDILPECMGIDPEDLPEIAI